MAETFTKLRIGVDFNGIYISRINEKIIIEISQITRNRQYYWRRIEKSEQFISDENKHSLTQFFIQNMNKLKHDNTKWRISVINGIYIVKNGNIFDAYINIAINTSDCGVWYKLNIFNTDLVNHICYFILHI